MEELSNKSGTRRKLLKGITATGANVIAANAVTGKTESDTKFRGVSYDYELATPSLFNYLQFESQ